MSFDEFFEQNWVGVLIFAGFVVFSIVVWIVTSKMNKKAVANYLAKNPDACKVYLTKGAISVKEPVQVHVVGGEKPARFTEKGKSGFYVKPGDTEVEISYTYTRPGVVNRSVTTTVGPVGQVITVEAGKTYYLSYDKKSEEFIFTENE